MIRERVLKVVLVVFGLLFVAATYPITVSLLHADRSTYTDDMMLSLYVALGVFLLIAVRNPAAHRSLIAFAAWANFAHASVMTVQAYLTPSERPHLLMGVGLFGGIGLVLLVLGPGKSAGERASAAGA